MKRMSAADAVMLLPGAVDTERMQQAIAWLGISRDVLESLTAVTFEPTRITFEVVALDELEPRTVTVEAVVTR